MEGTLFDTVARREEPIENKDGKKEEKSKRESRFSRLCGPRAEA